MQIDEEGRDDEEKDGKERNVSSLRGAASIPFSRPLFLEEASNRLRKKGKLNPKVVIPAKLVPACFKRGAGIHNAGLSHTRRVMVSYPWFSRSGAEGWGTWLSRRILPERSEGRMQS